MKRRVPNGDRAARDGKLAAMAAVAGAFSAFRPASAVLTPVRAVPTIWPQQDHATGVGGFPVNRFSLLHGPSAGGKTVVAIAEMLSFLVLGHPVLFIDAERTTPTTWLAAMMGEHFRSPLFFAIKPTTIEDIKREVRRFLATVYRLRRAGKLPPDSAGLVVLDSLRKLVLKDEWDLIEREMADAKAGKELGVNNRIAQTRARALASWLDELVPMLDDTGCGMLAIAREIVDPTNTNPKAIKAGTNVKTQGGSAVFYDASLDLRSKLINRYGKKVGEGESERVQAYGDRHLVQIRKSKVHKKGEDHYTSFVFHLSNGALVPEGFDLGRDVVHLARELGIVSAKRNAKGGYSGAHAFERKKWRSEDALVLALHEDRGLRAEVERACRARSREGA